MLVGDLATAAEVAVLDDCATAALSSSRRPIVLVPRRPGAPVADLVAPGLPELGLLLPYSPLHHLLAAGVGRPLVLTSGNLSDDPIAHEDDDAVARLGPMVDGILGHDRPIHIRCDDSVARASGGRLQLLRRSRGYAPEPMPLPVAARRHVLAVGAELKSTIAVAKDSMVVASHHIGDLEHLATYRSFLQAVDHLCDLYGVEPEVVACDLHPEYLSSKFAADLDLPIVAVQHHHAHLASAMVEHRRTDPVVALAFDGLGFGTDGTLWGGEILVGDIGACERAAHLRPVPMPGGVAAIREPWRMAAVWAGADAAAERGPRRPADGPRARRPAAVPVHQQRRAAVRRGGRAARWPGAGDLRGPSRHRARGTWRAGSPVTRRRRTTALSPSSRGRRGGRPRPHRPRALLWSTTAMPASTSRCSRPASTKVSAGRQPRLPPMWPRREASTRWSSPAACSRTPDSPRWWSRALLGFGLEVLVHQQVPANDGGISIGQAAVAAASPA